MEEREDEAAEENQVAQIKCSFFFNYMTVCGHEASAATQAAAPLIKCA